MKSKDLLGEFNVFYQETYNSAAVYTLKKICDFVELEDLLVSAYYNTYKKLKKSKTFEREGASKFLKQSLKKLISQYWEKHEKNRYPKKLTVDECSLLELEKVEFDIDEKTVQKQMLNQDIMEYISGQAPMMRRAYVLYYYFEMSIEEIAAELEITSVDVELLLKNALMKIQKNLLGEFI